MKKLVCTTFTAALTINLLLAAPPAIHIAKNGKGAPILFLPGFSTPGSVWEETIKALDGKFECHVISYAGFNGLEPIAMPWYATIKEELIAYIVEQDLTNVSIVGHSMGGTLGSDVAATIPDRIGKVLVVDGLPCMRAVMMPGVTADQIQYDSPYNNQMLSQSDSVFKVNATMMAKQMTMKEEKVDTIVDWMLQADRTTYVHGYTDLLKVDIRESLASVEAEVLVLAAPFPSKEQVMATFQEQFSNVEKVEFLIAENSRHFIMFDQEEWFYEQLNAFVSE